MQYNEANAIVDLDRYPIHNKQSEEYVRLVDQLRNELDQHQICTLPQFLREEPRKREVTAALDILDKGNRAHSFRNIYLERSTTPSLPDDHPKNILSEASYTMLGAHLLDESSAVKELYNWDDFREFVSDVTESGPLYPSADPYQPVNILCHLKTWQNLIH